MYDSAPATHEHRRMVQAFLFMIKDELQRRWAHHDLTKVGPVEKPIFDEYTPKLKDSTYGSEEYKGFLEAMKPALDHHYAKNRHHPEHFKKYECNGCFKDFDEQPDCCDICGYSQFTIRPDGIRGMNLVDLLEMFCDWKAATMRHADGDIMKSIDINQTRFGYGDDLLMIFRNSVALFNGTD